MQMTLVTALLMICNYIIGLQDLSLKIEQTQYMVIIKDNVIEVGVHINGAIYTQKAESLTVGIPPLKYVADSLLAFFPVQEKIMRPCTKRDRNEKRKRTIKSRKLQQL